MYGELSFTRSKKKEEEYESLEEDIEKLVSNYTQSDRCHNHTLGYVKLSGSRIFIDLLSKGYKFSKSTVNNILNRLNYTLKKVQKTKPLKKIEETDAIFENVNIRKDLAEVDSSILRVSVDVKAKVKIGEISRNGYNRHRDVVKALDKDQHWHTQLCPLGILEVATGQTTFVFGSNKETSDFIVDSLEVWYKEREEELMSYQTIMFELDCGPHVSGRRTQFLKRMTEFAQFTDKQILLVYYPPYHSKYNPIERVWAALEQYWNGTLLDSVKKTINTAANMTWKGINPLVFFNEKEYQHGISLNKKQMEVVEQKLDRDDKLRKWDILISP